jgi:Resolvase, N terminal domain
MFTVIATESMKIGYARVSTQDQKLELQLNALKSAGCQKIFREKVSGASWNRPEFQRMLDQVRSGDTVVVTITGTYAGRDARSIRFVVGGQVKTFPVENVTRIVFESTSAAGSNGADHTWPKAGTRAAPGPGTALAIPDEQSRFCEIVQDYRAANIRFSNEANPIKRAEMRKPNPYDWEERIVGVLGTSGRFDNWTGTVRN